MAGAPKWAPAPESTGYSCAMESILLPTLMALQTLALGAGLWLMSRRIGALKDEVAQLRQALEERRGVRKAAVAAGVVSAPASRAEPPSARAARVWRLAPAQGPAKPKREPPLEVWLVPLAAAPTLGFAFTAAAPYVSVAGILIGAAMMLAALRPDWKRAAWPGAAASAMWAAAAFIAQTPQLDPLLFSTIAALAAACGLAYAHARDPAPGAAMALAMGVALLALGATGSMVAAPGLMFTLLIAATALVGAANLRLEPLHGGSFVAALAGLYVFSGQPDAALWFTPAATLIGALFVGIAIVRVPQLGPRGVLIAGTGALAPLATIMALHAAQHGLAERLGAAGALTGLALLLGGVLALAAARRHEGPAALKLTAWVLAAAALACVVGAVALATPAPIAAALLMAAALALAATEWRLPSGLQNVLAATAALASGALAWISAAQTLTESAPIPTWTALAAGVGAPALIAALAARAARHREHVIISGWFETIAWAAAVACFSVALRLAFSGAAPLLAPIGGLEASAHVSAWLLAGLMIGASDKRARTSFRGAMITALSLAALSGGLVALAVWLRGAPDVGDINPLAVAAPALLLGAHWRYWRSRAAVLRTRVALGLATLLGAAALSLAVVQARAGAGESDWLSALLGSAAFAAAIVVNLAPGVVRRARSARA